MSFLSNLSFGKKAPPPAGVPPEPAPQAAPAEPAPALAPVPEPVPSPAPEPTPAEQQATQTARQDAKNVATAKDDKDRASRGAGSGLKKNISLKIPMPGFLSGLSTQEKINFARHLSVGIKSGLPLLEALKLIEGQAPTKKLKEVIGSVIDAVNNGQSLAQAIEMKYKNIFGDFFISMIRVGEASGNLAPSLLYLSQELKKQRDIRGHVKSAMIYPAVVLVATVGMTLGLTLFIFPKIIPIFTSLKVTLPFTTQLVIAFMTFLQTRGILAGIVLVVLFIGVRLLITIKKIHFYFDRMVLSLPVVKNIVIALTLANFTRSLAILLKSGMTIIDALAITKVTFHNHFYQYHVERIIDSVRRGEEIAQYMSGEPKLFPSMFTGMIKVGENTGNLEENLLYLSEYYTEEVETSVQNLTSLLEPMLVLVMGIVVGFVALSIIMPIYSITQGLNTH